MNDFVWKPIYLTFNLDLLSPEDLAVLQVSISQQMQRMAKEMNECLYPYKGARDEAVERLS